MTSLVLDSGSTVEVNATDTKGEVIVTLDDVSVSFTLNELALFRSLIGMASQDANGDRAAIYQAW